MARRHDSHAEQPAPPLDVTAPPSMHAAARGTTLLIVAFIAALVYLAYTLVTESPYYLAKAGAADYGIVLDRSGDVLFDGTKPLTDYPEGHFADVGNVIGDTSGQMSNTLIAANLGDLVNYSFLFGSGSKQPATLQTTLDHSANRAVFDALGSKNGAAVAYNWKTGEMLVCLSKPCIDIAKGYENLAAMEKGSLLCKVFYPTVPGSTQKVSTLIAAYEACGVDAVNAMQFSCSGSWVNAHHQQINCHERKGHGTEILQQAFENSCNPYFAQLVQSEKLLLSAVIETYTRMGYAVNGEPAASFACSGIRIAPASTMLTDPEDFDTQWGCLGQGKTLVSPYQLMLFQGAVASGTGSAATPYLLREKISADGTHTSCAKPADTPQFFSAEAAEAVRAVMTENARKHYYVSLGKYSCGVKSGTAQVTENGKEHENSLLAGFCLDEDCPVAFCVMIENRVSGELSTAHLAKVLLDALSGRS